MSDLQHLGSYPMATCSKRKYAAQQVSNFLPPCAKTALSGLHCSRCAFIGASKLSLSMHVAQAHRPHLRISTKSRCVEASIYRRLKLLPAKARHEWLMRHFTQEQRLALERWILSQQLLTKQTWQFMPQARASHAKSVKRGERSSHFPTSHWETRMNLHLEKPTHAVPESFKAEYSSSTGFKPARIWFRAACRTARETDVRACFTAQGSAGPFRLFTRFVSNHEAALVFQNVLWRIQHKVSVALQQKPGRNQSRSAYEEWAHGFKQVFCNALTETPGNYGLEPQAIGLSFAVAIPARYWIGKELLTPRFSACRVEDGLKAWQSLTWTRDSVHWGCSNRFTALLHNSRQELQAIWKILKEDYINLWVSSGRDRVEIQQNLLELETRRAQRRTVSDPCGLLSRSRANRIPPVMVGRCADEV